MIEVVRQTFEDLLNEFVFRWFLFDIRSYERTNVSLPGTEHRCPFTYDSIEIFVFDSLSPEFLHVKDRGLSNCSSMSAFDHHRRRRRCSTCARRRREEKKRRALK